MLILLLLLFLLFVVVSIFLAAWTLWFQAYMYSEPAPVLPWRAPAAGAGISGFIAFWVLLVALYPGRLGTLTTFAASEGQEYNELTVTDREGNPIERVRPDPKGLQVRQSDTYRKVGNTYRLDGQPNGQELPNRPEGVWAKAADGKELLFLPERDASGKFKVRERSFFGVQQSESLEYRNKETGRVMVEGQLGRVSRFYFGRFLANILLNLLHLAVWFVCLWLLLQFQWPHALGQAVILWAVTMLFVLPPLFSRAEALSTPEQPVRTSRIPAAHDLPVDG